jgi:hypothetical protein
VYKYPSNIASTLFLVTPNLCVPKAPRKSDMEISACPKEHGSKFMREGRQYRKLPSRK